MDALGTVLGVWAHPDDETYLSGALMAQAVAGGSRVVCVTATRGEQGSPDASRWPPGPGLATLRTGELEAALTVLGVVEHHWLDYPDGGCPDVDEAEAVARIRAFVDDVQPDTVLTFGPDGMTGHDDHRTVSRWTGLALGPGGADRLHHATHTRAWVDEFLPRLERVGALMGGELPVTDAADLSLLVRAEGDLLDLKERAMHAQASQIEPLVRAFGPAVFRAALVEEAYRHPG